MVMAEKLESAGAPPDGVFSSRIVLHLVAERELPLLDELEGRQRRHGLGHARHAEARGRLRLRPVRLGVGVAARVDELGPVDDGERGVLYRRLLHRLFDDRVDAGVGDRSCRGELAGDDGLALGEQRREPRRTGVRSRRLDDGRKEPLARPRVEFVLVVGRGHIVPGHVRTDLAVGEHREIEVAAVEGDEGRATPGGRLRIEPALILRCRVGDPVVVPQAGVRVRQPDRGVGRAARVAVGSRPMQHEPLLARFRVAALNGRKVAGVARAETEVGHWDRIEFLEDGGEARVGGRAGRADHDRAEALLGLCVEPLLELARGHQRPVALGDEDRPLDHHRRVDGR